MCVWVYKKKAILLQICFNHPLCLDVSINRQTQWNLSATELVERKKIPVITGLL